MVKDFQSVDPHNRKTVDHSAILHKATRVFFAKGLDETSIGDLARAAGVSTSTLYKCVGTKQDIFCAAVQEIAEREFVLAQEPLRTSASGREAITGLLEENVRLCLHGPAAFSCLFTFNLLTASMPCARLHAMLLDRRRTVMKQVRTRLAQSVRETELSTEVNVAIVAQLCVAVLSGLSFRARDGVPASTLLSCIELFVDGIGFRDDWRPPKK